LLGNGAQHGLAPVRLLDSCHIGRHTLPSLLAGEEVVMRLKNEVSNFTSACERLMFEADASDRTLREEESILIEYYCREVLKKVVKRSPSQQEKGSSDNEPPNIPSFDASKRTIGYSALT